MWSRVLRFWAGTRCKYTEIIGSLDSLDQLLVLLVFQLVMRDQRPPVVGTALLETSSPLPSILFRVPLWGAFRTIEGQFLNNKDSRHSSLTNHIIKVL